MSELLSLKESNPPFWWEHYVGSLYARTHFLYVRGTEGDRSRCFGFVREAQVDKHHVYLVNHPKPVALNTYLCIVPTLEEGKGLLQTLAMSRHDHL